MKILLFVTLGILGLLSLAYFRFVKVVLAGKIIDPETGASLFYLPDTFPWNLWYEGRSITLLLPLLGITIFAAWDDQLPRKPRSTYRVMVNHEWVGHAVQLRKDGYVFYPRYTFSRQWRWMYEMEAFVESIKTAYELGLLYRTSDNKRVGPLFHFARCLSEQYRLGRKYDFSLCYKELSERTQDFKTTFPHV